MHRLTETGKLGWAAYSHSRFSATYGVSLEEWVACEVECQVSKRARLYGLVGTEKQRGFNVGFAVVRARLKESNAKASNRRAKA